MTSSELGGTWKAAGMA